MTGMPWSGSAAPDRIFNPTSMFRDPSAKIMQRMESGQKAHRPTPEGVERLRKPPLWQFYHSYTLGRAATLKFERRNSTL